MEKNIEIIIDAGFFTGLIILSVVALMFVVMISAYNPYPKKLYDDIKRRYESNTRFGGVVGIIFKMLYVGVGLSMIFGLLKLATIAISF